MRIAVDATAAVRQYAGVGRFARGVLHGLARVDAHNDYVLLTTGAARLDIDPDNLPARRRWLRLPVSERLATILWQRLQIAPLPTWLAGRCSLFFTPDYALPATGSLPAVVTVHDLSFMTHPDCADERLRRYLSRVVPRSIRQAAAVVAVSATTARAVADLLGVPPAQITVVPNGIDPRFYALAGTSDESARDEALRVRLGLDPGYVLAVSTLEPRKNYVRLLQAFALARRRLRGKAGAGIGGTGGTPRLVIAGREGWLYEPIFREVARLGLAGAVRFLTRIEDSDLLTLYRGAQALIYPSLYEGFGIPPLEAMACGVPVAASTGGAIPEILGDAALLFDPYDVDGIASAIERVMLDDELRADLLARGTRRVAGYTWEESARQALGLFERVAAS